ncbi:MAG: ATP-grasp domain-containing protein [Clostridia bacterium]|nr:ATP-grasp domain-containing protein [Clostridia bacterium]
MKFSANDSLRNLAESNKAVGVTGIHIASAPKSGAVVLKELFRYPSINPLALVDYPQTCALGWLRKLKSIHLIPQGITGAEIICKRLIEIAGLTALDAVIPCDDEDVQALSNGKSMLKTAGIRTLLPDKTTVESVKKEKFQVTFEKIGIATPRQVVVWSLEELANFSLPFPVVVKGRLINAYCAGNKSEMVGLAIKITDVWGFPLIIQEFIEGAEFSVCLVADSDSRLAGACAIRKLGISEQGKTWRAVTIETEPFLPIMRKIVNDLSWVGPIEVEFLSHLDGSGPVAIEVNPRLPAWVPVSRHAGADLVELTVELCLGNASREVIFAEPGMCFARTYRTGVFDMEDMMQLYTHQDLPFRTNETNI